MEDMYEVSVKVISQKGFCTAQHKVGDEWVIKEDYLIPGGMCSTAYNAIHTSIMILLFGGAFRWETDLHVTRIACPDPNNPVILELRRLTKRRYDNDRGL